MTKLQQRFVDLKFGMFIHFNIPTYMNVDWLNPDASPELFAPVKRDVVKEYVDAFRKKGLKRMLYYSILDMHHKLRPGFITQSHIDLVKAQLTELLTHYGEITAIITLV